MQAHEVLKVFPTLPTLALPSPKRTYSRLGLPRNIGTVQVIRVIRLPAELSERPTPSPDVRLHYTTWQAACQSGCVNTKLNLFHETRREYRMFSKPLYRYSRRLLVYCTVRLYKPLIQHGVGYFYEAGYIGSHNVIPRLSVFLGRVSALFVYSHHYLVKLFIHFFS